MPFFFSRRIQRGAVAPGQNGLDIVHRPPAREFFRRPPSRQGTRSLSKRLKSRDGISTAFRQQPVENVLGQKSVFMAIHEFASGHLVLQPQCVGWLQLPTVLPPPVLRIPGVILAGDEQHALTNLRQQTVIHPEIGRPVATQGKGSKNAAIIDPMVPGQDTWIGAYTTPTCSRGDQKRKWPTGRR